MSDLSSKLLRWLATFVWIVAGAWLTFMSAAEVRFRVLAPPTPVEVAKDVIVTRVPDQKGRLTSFRILLFAEEFRWRLSSSNAIEDRKDIPVFTDEMKAVLDTAKEIVCVGASSEEVSGGLTFEQGRAQEERRAARRAEQLATWVRAALSKPVTIRKLNVGHHVPTKGSKDTSEQRPVVVIIVLDREEGADLDESLRAAMVSERERTPLFGSLLSNYSLVTKDRFTWVP